MPNCKECGTEVPYDGFRKGDDYFCQDHYKSPLLKLAATKGIWAP